MIIDLRNVPIAYINLKEHEQNKIDIENLLKSKGMFNCFRVPGIRVSGYEGDNYGQPIAHYMGVGLAQIGAMKTIEGALPAVVLEDDVDISEHFDPILEIADDVDAVYLGVSCAGNAYGYNLKNGFAKIFNVLAAHAILYISQKFTRACIETAKQSIIDEGMPFDIRQSLLLNNFNVITPINPYFYQSNNKQSANKWEDLTNRSLKIYG